MVETHWSDTGPTTGTQNTTNPEFDDIHRWYHHSPDIVITREGEHPYRTGEWVKIGQLNMLAGNGRLDVWERQPNG